MQNLNIIMCLDSESGFAKNGSIPWIDSTGKNKYPEDFKHFKKITKGNVCVMGRNTYTDLVHIMSLRGTEIGEEVLPGRKNYVLSRTGNFEIKGAEHSVNLREVYEKEKGRAIYILGGEKLIYYALPFVSTIYLTVLKQSFGCDRFFPVRYLQKYFSIESGEENNDLYFVKYKRHTQE